MNRNGTRDWARIYVTLSTALAVTLAVVSVALNLLLAMLDDRGLIPYAFGAGVLAILIAIVAALVERRRNLAEKQHSTTAA